MGVNQMVISRKISLIAVLIALIAGLQVPLDAMKRRYESSSESETSDINEQLKEDCLHELCAKWWLFNTYNAQLHDGIQLPLDMIKLIFIDLNEYSEMLVC